MIRRSGTSACCAELERQAVRHPIRRGPAANATGDIGPVIELRVEVRRAIGVAPLSDAVECSPRREYAGLARLCHCSEEMNHLATILPELYETFGADDARAS